MSSYASQRLNAIGVRSEAAHRVAKTLALSSQKGNSKIDLACGVAQSWVFIITGIVAAIAAKEKGGYAVLNIYGPETWIGENHILHSTSTSIEYICLTDVEFLRLSGDIFLQLVETEPGFVKHLTRLVAWRGQHSAEMLLLIKNGNPCLRSVIGLGLFFEALAARSNCPITNNMEDSITVPVKQDVIAQLCGVSRTSLWESMRRLEECGWLKIRYGELELLNLPAWRTVIRRRRECQFAKMDPTIDELLLEFDRADLAQPSPAHMYKSAMCS
jgi:CRP-like cAMP-binding protein